MIPFNEYAARYKNVDIFAENEQILNNLANGIVDSQSLATIKSNLMIIKSYEGKDEFKDYINKIENTLQAYESVADNAGKIVMKCNAYLNSGNKYEKFKEICDLFQIDSRAIDTSILNEYNVFSNISDDTVVLGVVKPMTVKAFQSIPVAQKSIMIDQLTKKGNSSGGNIIVPIIFLLLGILAVVLIFMFGIK